MIIIFMTKYNSEIAAHWYQHRREMRPFKNVDRENANVSEKWRKLSVNQEIPWVYPFPGYCSCSDIRNICLFFDEE